MEYLQNLVERCFERNAKPLRAKRAILHAVEDDTFYPYHAQVFYAHERDAMATRFAEVGLGILPIGHHGSAYFIWSDLFESHWNIMYTICNTGSNATGVTRGGCRCIPVNRQGI